MNFGEIIYSRWPSFYNMNLGQIQVLILWNISLIYSFLFINTIFIFSNMSYIRKNFEKTSEKNTCGQKQIFSTAETPFSKIHFWPFGQKQILSTAEKTFSKIHFWPFD